MRKNQGRLVLFQHTNIIESRDSENAYTKYKEQAGREEVQANPDLLEDCNENQIWGQGTKPELAEYIIERFMDSEGNFPALSKRQNQILRLYTQGMDINTIAKTVKLSRSSVVVYLGRIGRRFNKLLKALDF